MEKKKKKKSNNYFTRETEDAIIKYNQSTCEVEKNFLFNKHIHPAFDKLCEFRIHGGKFYNYDTTYEDLKSEAICHLVEKIDKFTSGRGKAFSFFTKVVTNFLIQENRKNYKIKTNTEGLDIVDLDRDLNWEEYRENKKDTIVSFTQNWVNYVDDNLEKLFPSLKERIICDSVLELFRISDELETFNKKKLYILVRERTGLKTQSITPVVNKLKKNYYDSFEKFNKSLS